MKRNPKPSPIGNNFGLFSYGSPCKAQTYEPISPVAMVETGAQYNRASVSPGSAGYRFGQTPYHGVSPRSQLTADTPVLARS